MEGYNRKFTALAAVILIALPLLNVFSCPCSRWCQACSAGNSEITVKAHCCNGHSSINCADTTRHCCRILDADPAKQKQSYSNQYKAGGKGCVHAIGDSAAIAGVVQLIEAIEADALPAAYFIHFAVGISQDVANVFSANDLSPPLHSCQIRGPLLC